MVFGLVDEENASVVSKALAFKDFQKDYFLLEKKMKEFLQSNNI